MSTIPLDLESDTVVLPQPVALPPLTLELALKRRHSVRSFLPDSVPLPALSALLWAAFGINRPDTGGRTAPSAHNWQEMDVYVALAEGTYRYDPAGHRLLLVNAEDLRRHTGTQDFVATAPVNFVYVANFQRMQGVRDEDRGFLAGADAGCIAQNVYLGCAALGLATVVRGLVDRRRLSQALDLASNQRIALAQSVGLARAEA